MSHREVEDVVDFGDDELNMAWDNPAQAQAPHPEDSSMEDRSLVEYREEDKFGSDSQDGGSQDGSYPDYDEGPNYDPEPDMTGNESPSSNVSDRGDASYDEFVDYEAYAQAVSARYPPSDEGGSNDDMDRSEEGGDSKSDSQDSGVRYPPSDVSGSNENMLSASGHRGSGEDAYDSDSQDTSVRYPLSDSDEDMLTSSQRLDIHENADIDDELYELARPPSPMSTDEGSESDDDRQAPSPMNTDVKSEDTKMTEAAAGQPATSFHSEMSEIETYPLMSGNQSETVEQRVPSLTLKSQISPFDMVPSSPPQPAYTAPANPNFVIDFGVDTNDLAPLKLDTDMSEAPAPPESQDTMQHQPDLEPALQSITDELAVADLTPQADQDTPMDVPADATTAPASVEKPAAIKVPSSSFNYNFDTKKSPTVASPALQSFDPSAWSTPFNFAPSEPVGVPQHSAPTNESESSGKDDRVEEQHSLENKSSPVNEAGSSEKDNCTEMQRSPENTSSPLTEAESSGQDNRIEAQHSPEPKPTRPSSYKDAGTQTVQTTPSAETSTPEEWIATAPPPDAERRRKLFAAMESYAVRDAALLERREAFSVKMQAHFEKAVAERDEMRARHAKKRAERARRHAEMEARHAQWEKDRAEDDERTTKCVEDVARSMMKFHTAMVAHLARCDAFVAKMDGYSPPDFLSQRTKELLAQPYGRSPEVQKLVDEAEAAIAEWNARYEAHVAKVEALGEKIKAVKL